MYRMELALIMYLLDNDCYARFMMLSLTFFYQLP